MDTGEEVRTERRGGILSRLRSGEPEAHEGIEVLGGLSARVISGGPVIIGPHARWQGDCHAPSLEIRLGRELREFPAGEITR